MQTSRNLRSFGYFSLKRQVKSDGKGRTRRGGRRVRAGDKPKALSDKIAEGKDADIIEFYAPELDAADLDDAADLTGADMPSPVHTCLPSRRMENRWEQILCTKKRGSG